jgi:hypothetical protein
VSGLTFGHDLNIEPVVPYTAPNFFVQQISSANAAMLSLCSCPNVRLASRPPSPRKAVAQEVVMRQLCRAIPALAAED